MLGSSASTKPTSHSTLLAGPPGCPLWARVSLFLPSWEKPFPRTPRSPGAVADVTGRKAGGVAGGLRSRPQLSSHSDAFCLSASVPQLPGPVSAEPAIQVLRLSHGHEGLAEVVSGWVKGPPRHASSSGAPWGLVSPPLSRGVSPPLCHSLWPPLSLPPSSAPSLVTQKLRWDIEMVILLWPELGHMSRLHAPWPASTALALPPFLPGEFGAQSLLASDPGNQAQRPCLIYF